MKIGDKTPVNKHVIKLNFSVLPKESPPGDKNSNEADSAIELVDVKVDLLGPTNCEQNTNHSDIIESDSCLTKSETITEKEL